MALSVRGVGLWPLTPFRWFSRRRCINQRLSITLRRSSSKSESIKAESGSSPRFERRIFSGIQPTGVPHLGNYFGAIKHWVALQERYNNVILSVVDMHSITLPQDPHALRQNIRDMIACLIACGIDPDKTILFQQSSVSQHAELAWVLGCLTTMPRLQHLPQWKQKSEELKEVPLGLFTYPVLQAADVLLYKATDVPVGDDQVKHIELARHLVKLFNNKYGVLFPTPSASVGDFKRIRSLRKPDRKMSKSEKDPRGRIELTDSPEEIHEKFKKAVTDLTSAVTYEPENRPGVSNLVDIHSAFVDLPPEQICEQLTLVDTLQYKKLVAEIVNEKLRDIRERALRLQKDPGYLDQVIVSGNQRARDIAEKTYTEVRQKIGFI